MISELILWFSGIGTQEGRDIDLCSIVALDDLIGAQPCMNMSGKQNRLGIFAQDLFQGKILCAFIQREI